MSHRAYIRIEPQDDQDPDEQGMVTYWLNAYCDDGSNSDEFDFQAPAGLIEGGEFAMPSRAMMWVAAALADQAIYTEDSINTLLPLGHVSLEVGLASDESTLRGGGQRLAWVAREPLSEIGASCHTRDVQWALEQSTPEVAPSKHKPRL